MKTDYISRVYKFITKIISHDFAVQVFAPGGGVHRTCLGGKLFLDRIKVIFQGEVQLQPADDLIVTIFDLPQLLAKCLAVFCQFIAFV